MYVWLGHEKSLPEETVAVRELPYLAERGYLDLEDLPRIFGAIERGSSDPQDSKPLMEIIRRLIATRMGVPATDPIPKSLDFLLTAENALASLDGFCRSLDGRSDVSPTERQAFERWFELAIVTCPHRWGEHHRSDPDRRQGTDRESSR